MPPSPRWKLPEGLTAGELQYPTPERLRTPAGINYVYHDRAVLLVELKADASVSTGSSVTIECDLLWLVCDADECLPESSVLRMTLPVAESSQPTHANDFERWREVVREGQKFEAGGG
jgi:DsbC/DsbD-like thiol-disulfide interchange protein